MAQQFTFCQEPELNLENVASSTLVKLPGILFHPTFKFHVELELESASIMILLYNAITVPWW